MTDPAQEEIFRIADVILNGLAAEGEYADDQMTMLALQSLAARFAVLLGVAEQHHVDMARAAFGDATRDHAAGEPLL